MVLSIQINHILYDKVDEGQSFFIDCGRYKLFSWKVWDTYRGRTAWYGWLNDDAVWMPLLREECFQRLAAQIRIILAAWFKWLWDDRIWITRNGVIFNKNLLIGACNNSAEHKKGGRIESPNSYDY